MLETLRFLMEHIQILITLFLRTVQPLLNDLGISLQIGNRSTQLM